MRTIFTPRFWLALALVIAGVVFRIIPHPWNFAPIGAIALFGGARFERRSLAIGVPLIAMFIGDWVMGFHHIVGLVYATYSLIAVLGFFLRDRKSVPAIAAGSLASSVIFFIVTNFGTWAAGTMYAKTASGLLTCYIAGIPFFGNTIASDAFFNAIFFGVFAIAERALPATVEP